jgi:hypothetical protein
MEEKECRIFLKFISNKWVGKGWIIDEIAIGKSIVRNEPAVAEAFERNHTIKSTINQFEQFNSAKIDAIFVHDPNQDKDIINYIGAKGKTRKERLSQLEGKKVWLFEVKEYLKYEALGQILTYNYHFIRDYPRTLIEGLGIICEPNDSFEAMRIVTACNYYGIKVFIV